MAGISNKDLYDALERIRIEGKGDIRVVQMAIDELRKDVGELKVKEAITSTKIATIAVTASLVITIVLNIIAWKLFGFPGH